MLTEIANKIAAYPMSRRRVLTSAAVAALALSTGPRARADAPIIIKFSHVAAPTTPKGLGADKFKELAAKYTDGKVQVEVYPNSQLYTEKEELEALRLNAVQMLVPATSKFAPLGIKEYEAFDLPFMFPDQATWDKVSTGPIGKMLLAKLEPQGVKGLAYWDSGFFVMTANRPLHVPADFQGLKMRIQSSKVIDAQMRALGALPQVITFAELYQALQSGVVDGAENTPTNYYTQKIYEVQKHLTVSHHSHSAFATLTNLQFWNGLSPEVQAQLEKAMAETTVYVNSIVQTQNDDALDAIRKSGVTTVYELTPEEKQKWIAALLPVHQAAEARVGADLISQLHQEAGFKVTQ